MKHAIVTTLCLLALSTFGAAPKKKAAEPKASAPSIETLYERAEAAAASYNTELTDEAVEALGTALRKADRGDEERFKELEAIPELMANMLDRVEDIRFIDAINIARDKMFKDADISFPLSSDAGRWHGSDWFADKDIPHDSLSIAFIPSTGREMYWSAPKGSSRTIWQAGILLDGSLDNIHPLFDPQDYNYDIDLTTPFLSPDGLTLYFAGRIPGASIGSHDIFRAVRDGVGEDFSKPINLGMPYSSTGFDGFYAEDPVSGLSFFATDRACPGGDMMTVFAFLPNEMRVNRPVDFADPTLNLSEGDSIAAFIPTTWPEGFDAQPYKKSLRRIADSQGLSNARHSATPEFSLYIPAKKRVYTSLDDFTVHAAAEAMRAAIETRREIDSSSEALAKMRRVYANGNHSHEQGLLDAEQRLKLLRGRLQSQLNTAVRLEQPR